MVKMMLNNEVIFEGTKAQCFREMIKRNLSYINENEKYFYVSEEIFADFGNFYEEVQNESKTI